MAAWFAHRARRRGDLEVDVIDLGTTRLPAVLPAARDPDVTAFAARIDRADAYVVVTPEYNHGYPAALKHALDLGYMEWHNKVAGFVSYGGISGGLRAVEQLRLVFAELQVATVRDGVSLHLVNTRFDDGAPRDADVVNDAATVMLDQLVCGRRRCAPPAAPPGPRPLTASSRRANRPAPRAACRPSSVSEDGTVTHPRTRANVAARTRDTAARAPTPIARWTIHAPASVGPPHESSRLSAPATG